MPADKDPSLVEAMSRIAAAERETFQTKHAATLKVRELEQTVEEYKRQVRDLEARPVMPEDKDDLLLAVLERFGGPDTIAERLVQMSPEERARIAVKAATRQTSATDDRLKKLEAEIARRDREAEERAYREKAEAEYGQAVEKMSASVPHLHRLMTRNRERAISISNVIADQMPRGFTFDDLADEVNTYLQKEFYADYTPADSNSAEPGSNANQDPTKDAPKAKGKTISNRAAAARSSFADDEPVPDLKERMRLATERLKAL